MSSTESLMPSDMQALSKVLSEINEIDTELTAMGLKEKELKKRRDYLARLAVDEMQESRLDGVKVAGRSWRIEQEHSLSLPRGKRQEAIAVAERLGIAEDMVTLMTGTLKSYLRERATDAGKSKDAEWAEGTEFDGLVTEFVRPVLRHLTTG